LEPEVEKMRLSLQDGVYLTIDSALDDIELIKQKYIKNGPKFNGTTQILSETCSQLVVKAATYVSIASR
jgi:hypothetical protein